MLPLAVTLAVHALVALAVYCAPVIAPVAGPELGVPASHIGYYIAIVYLGSMFGSVSGGGFVARFGAIRVSQAGLALCLLGLALGALAGPPMLALVALGAFCVGLGYGPTTPASSQILVRATPPHLLAITFSLKQTGVPLGAAIAGVLAPTLVLAIGWRWAAVGIGLGCFALAALIEPTRRFYDTQLNATAPISFAAAFAPLALVVRDRRLAEMAVTSFVFGGAQITLMAHLVNFLVASFQMPLVLAGLVMAVSQIASVIGRIVWGFVADRLLSRRAMLGLLGIGMGASGLCALMAHPGWPLPLLFLYAALFGATAVGWNGVYLAEVARLAPHGQISQATGACLFFTFLGAVVSPPLFSYALSPGGSYASAYAAFGAPALLIGAWLLVFRTGFAKR